MWISELEHPSQIPIQGEQQVSYWDHPVAAELVGIDLRLQDNAKITSLNKAVYSGLSIVSPEYLDNEIGRKLSHTFGDEGLDDEHIRTRLEEGLRVIDELSHPNFQTDIRQVPTHEISGLLQKAHDTHEMRRMKNAGIFEHLDMPKVESETGFTQKDVAVLMGGSSSETQDKISTALSTYAHTRDRFFDAPGDSQAFREYMENLMILTYGDRYGEAMVAMSDFLNEPDSQHEPEWVRDEVSKEPANDVRVYYSAYVDKMGGDFAGLTKRLQYLKDLGITRIWLLPSFESSGVDNGYDIKDRYSMAESLGGNQGFFAFTEAAKTLGLEVKLDMVLNHGSFEDELIQAALDERHPDYEQAKDLIIVRDTGSDEPPADYPAWPIFGGLKSPVVGKEQIPDAGEVKTSNWTRYIKYDAQGTPKPVWVMTRFFAQMVDWNFDNPAVLVNELRRMQFWGDQGNGVVREFRLDAAKHIVKKDRNSLNPDMLGRFPGLARMVESYKCDNLPQTHLVLRAIRAYMEHRYQGLVEITPEIWDNDKITSTYWGKAGEEANNQFGFKTMDHLTRAILSGDAGPMYEAVFSESSIPENTAIISTLATHDGAAAGDSTKGMTDAALHEFARRLKLRPFVAHSLVQYGYDPAQGLQFEGGFAARMRNIYEAIAQSKNPDKILARFKLAMSTLFGVAHSPLIFQGDEFLQGNDDRHLLAVSKQTQSIDMRNAKRNILSEKTVKRKLSIESSLEFRAHALTKHLIELRKQMGDWRAQGVVLDGVEGVFAASRAINRPGGIQQMLMVSNFSGEMKHIRVPVDAAVPQTAIFEDLLKEEVSETRVTNDGDQSYLEFDLKPYDVLWLVPSRDGGI